MGLLFYICNIFNRKITVFLKYICNFEYSCKKDYIIKNK